MGYDERWLPYLGDLVELQVGGVSLRGRVSRFDPTLVEVEQQLALIVGQPVAASWVVGADVHDSGARIEELTEAGFSVRLPQARVSPETRRQHDRHSLSLRMHVAPAHHGSLGFLPRQGRTLDLSNAGARALIDTDSPIGVGQVLEVQLEVGNVVHTLMAEVMWERGHGAGERLAGLKFQGEVQATTWAAMAHAQA